MEFKTTNGNKSKRVHREYVGVIACFERDGSITPIRVLWKDARSFPVDEVLEAGAFGHLYHGRQTACYRIRLGSPRGGHP